MGITLVPMERAAVKSQNLSEEEVTRRLRVGVVALAGTLGSAFLVQALGSPIWARLALFLPLFIACSICFQTIYTNCPFSALRGVRHAPCGASEPIADPEQLRAARLVGRKQLYWTVLTSIGLTALFFFML